MLSILLAGETHLHMQQYIRATQLPITTKFTLSPFTKEEVSRPRNPSTLKIVAVNITGKF